VTAEVDRGGGVVDLVRQDGQLVVNPLSSFMTLTRQHTATKYKVIRTIKAKR